MEDADEDFVDDLDADLGSLPLVVLRHDLVPDELDPARFFGRMLMLVMDNSPITHHREARHLRP